MEGMKMLWAPCAAFYHNLHVLHGLRLHFFCKFAPDKSRRVSLDFKRIVYANPQKTPTRHPETEAET
jgi:hypothetical protein